MERAATLAKVMGNDVVDQGLGAAAAHHRFTHEDLVSIITNTATGETPVAPSQDRHIVTDQSRWLSQGTSGWANFGTTDPTATPGEEIIPADITDLEGAAE